MNRRQWSPEIFVGLGFTQGREQAVSRALELPLAVAHGDRSLLGSHSQVLHVGFSPELLVNRHFDRGCGIINIAS
jgi:hypothetical protein